MNKLSKKLITLNIGILIGAMLLVTVILSALVTNYVRQDLKNDLETENKIAARIYYSTLQKTDTDSDSLTYSQALYKKLADSTNVIFLKDNATGEYQIAYSSNVNFKKTDEVRNLLDSITDENEGKFFEFTIGENKYLAKVNSFRESLAKSETSIIIVSFIPANQIRAINVRIVFSIILSSLIIFLLSAIILGVFSRKLTKPLAVLNRAAKRFANRKFDKKINIESNDEIGELAQSVNEMAQSLKAYDSTQRKFIRNISHELKTPLTAIRGYAEGLKSGLFPDKDATLKIIIDESTRISDLVNNIIYFDKLESGLEPYAFALKSMNETIIKAIEKIESIAILNDIEINFIPEEDVVLNIDAEKMTRVFINILSNCIKYTKDAIFISAKQEKNSFLITIIDNGEGFDAHILKNLFDKAVVGEKEGSGLGLIIAQEIVIKHGGTLNASNHESRGAQFIISLPIN